MVKQDIATEELLREISALRNRNAELEALEVKHNQMETTLREQAHDLRERIKEINCLYGISKLVEKSGAPLVEIYQGIVDLIPSSWQYPEITSALLTIHNQTYNTHGHKNTPWKQSADIVIYGEHVGTLTVCYHEQRPKSHEGPFLREERSLLNAVAERLIRITEQKQMEKALREQAHHLRERIKEINCLYGISKLVENNENTIEEIYQGIVDLIPASWQYPEITSAQLTINGQDFYTEGHRETKWKQFTSVVVYGELAGELVVCYQEKRPRSYEGPFLKEECSLLKEIAERLGRITERNQAENALNESERQLKRQNLQLQEKNIALREIMEQVLTEKKNLEARVLANVDRLIVPLLRKLKNKDKRIEKQYLHLLEENLMTLTSPFGSKISRIMPKLTPRENEICNMIRTGLTSKEIASLLNISYRSVETYRNYIRKKLGITNKKINLITYFADLEASSVHAE